MEKTIFKSGFAAIIGKPNAGKSTLMNAFLGEKISIVTHKAQTTRHRIFGILNEENYQIVFSDTPGIIHPKYGLHKAMMKAVRASLEDADVILWIVDIGETFSEDEVLELLKGNKIPVVLILNKSDLFGEEEIAKRKKELEERIHPAKTFEISALKKKGLDKLRDGILELLDEGPKYFDAESLSDRPMRFFVSEVIREKLFLHLGDELPYSCEVTILTFEEKETMDVIRAEIHVERKSQKGMVIGEGGKKIKQIGMEARTEIEGMTGRKAFLELYVRVAENWKDSDMRLRDFGYEK